MPGANVRRNGMGLRHQRVTNDPRKFPRSIPKRFRHDGRTVSVCNLLTCPLEQSRSGEHLANQGGVPGFLLHRFINRLLENMLKVSL